MSDWQAPRLTLNQVETLRPCSYDAPRVYKLLTATGQQSWSAAEAVAAGCTLDDLLWIAGRLSRHDAEIARRLRHFAADCAVRVLPIFERDRPGDNRPRAAIQAARDYAEGLIDAEASDAARAAASDAARAAASDAERAWQLTRLIAWMSDGPGPEPLPLPALEGVEQ